MRNLLFVLALGIGATVHFTHRLSPDFPAAGSVFGQAENFNSTHYVAPTRPAVWLPSSTPADGIRRSSACVDKSAAAPETLTAFLEQAPPCDTSGRPVKAPPSRGF